MDMRGRRAATCVPAPRPRQASMAFNRRGMKPKQNPKSMQALVPWLDQRKRKKGWGDERWDGCDRPGGWVTCLRASECGMHTPLCVVLLSSRRYDPTECRRRIEAQLDTLVERGIRHAVLSGVARKSSYSAWPLV